MLDEEQLGVDKILPRNVCKQHSEGDREKEHRLELLSYRKIEKYPDYQVHYQVFYKSFRRRRRYRKSG